MKYIEKYWIIIIIAFFCASYISPALPFLMFGSLLCYISISAFLFLRKMETRGVECMGRILSIESDGRGFKTPLIEFTPTGGDPITEKPFIHATTTLPGIGYKNTNTDVPVSVLYDPDNPKKFVLAGEDGGSYFAFIIFLLGGLGAVIIGIYKFME